MYPCLRFSGLLLRLCSASSRVSLPHCLLPAPPPSPFPLPFVPQQGYASDKVQVLPKEHSNRALLISLRPRPRTARLPLSRHFSSPSPFNTPPTPHPFHSFRLSFPFSPPHTLFQPFTSCWCLLIAVMLMWKDWEPFILAPCKRGSLKWRVG